MKNITISTAAGGGVLLVYQLEICPNCTGHKVFKVDERTDLKSVCHHCGGSGVNKKIVIDLNESAHTSHLLAAGVLVQTKMPELPADGILDTDEIHFPGKSTLFPHPHSIPVSGEQFKKGARPKLTEGVTV